MKKLILILSFFLVCLNMSAIGFKVKMDQTYNSVNKGGEWVNGDILDAKSVITINVDSKWIYFDTAHEIFFIKEKTQFGWVCTDANGGECKIRFDRSDNDSYLVIEYESIKWIGRITKEKPVWRPITRPFHYQGHHFRPEMIPFKK